MSDTEPMLWIDDVDRGRFCVRFMIGLTLGSMGSAACADRIFEVAEYASVTVDVTRLSGEPVAGVHLDLYIGDASMAIAKTDEAGRYVFDFVPPNIYGLYAEPPTGYVRLEELLDVPISAFVTGIVIEQGDRKNFTFTYFKVGPGRIEVTVTEPDGIPVEGARIFLSSPFEVVEEEVTGPTGRITFDPVHFGNWGVRVAPPDFHGDAAEPDPFQDGIIIEDGSVAETIFRLERCEGDLTVRVLDESGGSVADHPLILYRSSGIVEEGRTGGGGERAFGPLPCRGFGIALVRFPGWNFEEGRGTSFIDGIEVTSGSSQAFTFYVERCLASIRASVVDGAGASVAGASVALFTSLEEVIRRETDASGAVVFTEVGCGIEYGVKVIPPAGYTVEEGRGSSFFDGLFPSKGEELVVTFRVDRS